MLFLNRFAQSFQPHYVGVRIKRSLLSYSNSDGHKVGRVNFKAKDKSPREIRMELEQQLNILREVTSRLEDS